MTTTCCLPWPVVWPCNELPAHSDEQMAAATSAAQRMLWTRTGRRLGMCTVTELFWPASAGGACGVPYMRDGDWYNGGRSAGCTLQLSYRPVQLVNEVRVHGVALAATGYVLQRGGFLMRIGGDWPAVGECEHAPVEVDYTWGASLHEPLWGSVALAMGEVTYEVLAALCGQPCKLPSRAVSVTRQGVTVNLADPSTAPELLGLPLADALILSENPGKKAQRSGIRSPDMARASARTPTELPGATPIMGVSTVTLPVAYEGDPYSFNLTFPDESYLVGAPGNVVADIVLDPDLPVAVGAFTPTVAGGTLTLTLDPVALTPGHYWTDVSVGGVTYLHKTRLEVAGQVSM